MLEDRSSFLGLCLEVADTSGDEGGSFFTMILGGPCLVELGERFPSGVAFCFAATSLSTTGALGDVVREAADADLRSAEAVCVEGARIGKLDWGLEPGSDEGGASGAETDATAVDMSKVV